MGTVTQAHKQAKMDYDIEQLRENLRITKDKNRDLLRQMKELTADIDLIISMVNWIEEENETQYELENGVNFLNYLYSVKAKLDAEMYRNKQ